MNKSENKMVEKLHINCVSCGNCQHPRDVDNLPLFCMECSPTDAPCLKVCPNQAIESFGGAITLNKSKCDKCGKCKPVCHLSILDTIIK
jgi:Fe-S-cluster-containing hydrogenase component 2